MNIGLSNEMRHMWNKQAFERGSIVSNDHRDHRFFTRPDGRRLSISLDVAARYKEDIDKVLRLWQNGALRSEQVRRQFRDISKKAKTDGASH